MSNATIINAQTFLVPPVLSLANTTANTLPYTTIATPNPNVTFVGTSIWPLPYTVSYQSIELNNVTSPQLLNLNCNWFVEPNITSIDFGNAQSLTNFNISTWPLCTSMSGANVVYLNASPAGTWPVLTTFSFPNVSSILSFSPTFSVLTNLSFPALIAVQNTFSPTCPLVTTFNTPVMTMAHTYQPVLAALTSFSLPACTTITNTFGPTFAACTTFSTPVLSFCGNMGLVVNSLTTLSFPALTIVLTNFQITAANLVTFSFPSTLKSIGGNCLMTGMKLNQASVDGILVSLAALDGTNGTTAYSSHTVNLSGGTSATPSSTGLAAKTTLVGRGCTVTTN